MFVSKVNKCKNWAYIELPMEDAMEVQEIEIKYKFTVQMKQLWQGSGNKVYKSRVINNMHEGIKKGQTRFFCSVFFCLDLLCIGKGFDTILLTLCLISYVWSVHKIRISLRS